MAAPGPGMMWLDPDSREVQVCWRDMGRQLRLLVAVEELLSLVSPRGADNWHLHL